jgi:hypothetical protein
MAVAGRADMDDVFAEGGSAVVLPH